VLLAGLPGPQDASGAGGGRAGRRPLRPGSVRRAGAPARDLFQQAAAKAPAIIFTDELTRSASRNAGQARGHDEREQT
jgi:hypothetical protein